MKGFLKNVGRGILGALYLAVPVLGWIAFAKSMKRVNPGEIALVNNVSGTYEILEEGMHFRPIPGDRFSKSFNKSDDYIDMGPIKRVRIKQGQQGVMNENGEYKPLGPGIHIIDGSKNQTFNRDRDIQDISQLDYTLGATRYVTIANGEIGESYLNGEFRQLDVGKHALPPNHRFVKKVSVADEIIDLGALKIVTVNQGAVAIVNGDKGSEVKGPGKHFVRQTEGNYLRELVTVSAQILELKPIVVQCTDKIEMKADAVVLYEISDALKTVGSGMKQILTFLDKYADATLRGILKRFSSSDISLTLHHDEDHFTNKREEKLQKIHDEAVQDLSTKAKDWGIKIIDLKLTQILPASEQYHATLRELGTRQSTAEANKTIAEAEAQVAIIRAQAEQSKVTAAKIEQQEAWVRAETDLQTKKMQSEAEYFQSIKRSQAQADGIKIVAQAQSERLEKLAKAVDGIQSKTGQDIARMDKQIELYEKVKNPVLIQPPQIGTTNVWTKEDNRTTFFTNSKPEKSGTNNVRDWLQLEVSDRIRKMPGKSS